MSIDFGKFSGRIFYKKNGLRFCKPKRVYSMDVKIGKTLKALRKSFGLTQAELAKQLNLSRVNYTRYETDASRPDYEILIAIADFYKVSLDEIFDRDFIK